MDTNSPLDTSKGYNDEDGVSLVDKLELNSFKSREECGVDGLNPDSKVPPDETIVYIRKGYVSPSMPLCETNEEEPQYALAGSNLADSSLSVTKVEVMEPKMLDYHIERPGSPNRDNEKQEHKVDFNTNVKDFAEVKDLNHRHDKGDADHYNSTDRGCFGKPNMKSSTPDDAGNCKYDQDSIDSLPEGIEVNEEMDVENLNQKHGFQRQMTGDDSSGMATPENGRMVWENSSLKSPQETHNLSLSPERRLSISAERSHHNQSPPKGHTSPKKGMPSTAKFESSLAPSPQSSKRRRSPSPEKRTFSHKRASSQDRSSPSKRLRSPSERASKREAHHRVDSPRRRVSRSPPRHDSPRRRGRSSSKSPTRRRGSPGHQRDHRHSRSPITRNRNRRSPRRQSPRRRSPPTYSSRHRSSRRPWSPPPNRNTGLGRPGKNLFIAGFSYGTTERDLERKFSKFGRVTDVRIVRDTRSGDSRGFGFLSLERDEEADAAIRAVDQTEWNGRIVLVEKSKSTR